MPRFGLLFFSIVLFSSLRTMAADTRPNIVFILLDDLDKVVTEPFFPQVLPHLISLKKEGIYFDNAFAPTALCCPARATILTGQYGHNTHVLTNGGDWGGWGAFKKNGNEARTIAAYLHRAGFRTAMVGKYLNGFALNETGAAPPTPEGWSEGHVFVDPSLQSYQGYDYTLLNWVEEKGNTETQTQSFGHEEKDYSTDVVRDYALKFLDKTKQDKRPFFLYITPTAPHFPLPAAPRHQKRATQWKGTLPKGRPNFYADGKSIDDKPLWLRWTWRKRTGWLSHEWNRRDWFKRMGSLYAADELIEAVVNHLKASHRWDNTLLVIASDNGYNLGAHALINKMAPYEESIRVPLLISGGKNVDIRRNEIEKRWVLHTDFAPTFLDISGLPVPQEMDGSSLVPLLRNPSLTSSWRHDLLLEYLGAQAGEGVGLEIPLLDRLLKDIFAPVLFMDLPSYRGLRASLATPQGTKDFTYVEWQKMDSTTGSIHSKHEFELYNVTDDPYELDNLIYYRRAEYQPLCEELQARLEALSRCRGLSCRP